MSKTKECAGCKIIFQQKYYNQAYCSKECYKKAVQIKDIEKKTAKNKSRYGDDVIQCQMCSFAGRTLTNHIVGTHHITTEEYRNAFPGHPFCSESYIQQYSEAVKGEKNPAYQHGGKFSPFSTKFVGKANREETINKAAKNREYPNRVEYYTKRGYSEEEAKHIITKRQRTFSLEKCIQKHGEEVGTQKWKDRQQRWQNTLKSKPIEEQNRIKKAKVASGYTTSKPEKEIIKHLNSLGYNCEPQKCVGNFIYDCACGQKIIEFNGDYWHCNPRMYKPEYYNKRLKMSAGERWLKDEQKIQEAKNFGYDVLVVWEKDFLKDKQLVLDKCAKFIENS